jgi:hypothetical protein
MYTQVELDVDSNSILPVEGLNVYWLEYPPYEGIKFWVGQRITLPCDPDLESPIIDYRINRIFTTLKDATALPPKSVVRFVYAYEEQVND